MKNIWLILIMVFSGVSGFSQNGKPAKELFLAALTKAKAEHKNVFIIFTASWCGPCKYLKSGIHDVYNAPYFEKHYIFLELYNHEIGSNKSMENYGADSILKSYKGITTSIPYWLILDPTGKKLYAELGFSNYPDDLQRFKKVLKFTSHLDDGELNMIIDRFVQIAKQVLESD